MKLETKFNLLKVIVNCGQSSIPTVNPLTIGSISATGILNFIVPFTLKATFNFFFTAEITYPCIYDQYLPVC